MNERELMDIRVAEMKRQNEVERLQEESFRRRQSQRALTAPKDDGKPKEVIATIEDGKVTDWQRWTRIFGFKV